MKLKIAFASATALGLLIGGAAYAGNTNEAYLEQDGDGNLATIQQSAGSGGNRVGTTTDPILQQGDNNTFSETQSTGGGFSRGDNVIEAGRQLGNSNSFSSNYSNNTGFNTIDNLLQQGNSNNASVGRNGSNVLRSYVGDILQQGNSNFLAITQGGGADNSVEEAVQIGSNNGWSTQPPGGNGSRRGTVISQSGNRNLIESSRIEGSFNNSSGAKAAHRIYQTGDDNGQDVSIANTLGSNGNWIHVTQTGNSNNFDLRQGITTASTQNSITLVQTGDGNLTTATQYGSYNTLNASQSGNSNTITALVTGDNNGSGVFGNVGASALATANALTSGDIFQSGLSHTVSLTINSSGNQFAFLQTGGSLNTITATVSGSLGNNQAVGVQNGSSNAATLTQGGNSNVAVFNQQGGSNSTTITQ